MLHGLNVSAWGSSSLRSKGTSEQGSKDTAWHGCLAFGHRWCPGIKWQLTRTGGLNLRHSLARPCLS